MAYTKTPSQGLELAGKALRSYVAERHGATVVLAQTPWPAALLRRKVRAGALAIVSHLSPLCTPPPPLSPLLRQVQCHMKCRG